MPLPLIKKESKASSLVSSLDSRTQRIIADVWLSIEQNNALALYENLNTWFELLYEEKQQGEWSEYFHLFLMMLMKQDKLRIFESLLIQGIDSDQARTYPLVWQYCLSDTLSATLFSDIFYLNLLANISKRYPAIQALVLKNNPGLLGMTDFSHLEADGQWLSLQDLCRRADTVLPMSLWVWYILKNYTVDIEFCKQLLSLCQHANDYPVYYYTIIRHVLSQVPVPTEGPSLALLQTIFSLWSTDYQTNFIEPRIAFTHWALANLSQYENPIAQVFSCILLLSERHLLKTSELEQQAASTPRKMPPSLKPILWLKGSTLGKTVLGIKALVTDAVDELNETYGHRYYSRMQRLSAADLRYFPKNTNVVDQLDQADKVALAQWIDLKQSIETVFSSPVHQTWLLTLSAGYPVEKMQTEYAMILAKYLHWLVILKASHTERVSYLFAKLKTFVNQCEVMRRQLGQLRDQGFIVSEQADHYYEQITRKIMPVLGHLESALKNNTGLQLHQDKVLQRFKKTLLDLFVDDYVRLKAWFYQAKHLTQQLGATGILLDAKVHRWLHGLVDRQQDEGGESSYDYSALYLPKYREMVQATPAVDQLQQTITGSLLCLKN